MMGDLQMWLQFLKHPSAYCRPFLDLSKVIVADEIKFFMDTSKNPELGFGGHCGDLFMQAQWDYDFMIDKDPSIQYLELFALTAGVLAWLSNFKNKRIVIFSDNNSVVSMINNTLSSCKNCMYLIRQIILHCLINNVRLYTKHVRSEFNEIADSLSRLQWDRFEKLTKYRNMTQDSVPQHLWPLASIWID